jgi:hypothetical protein
MRRLVVKTALALLPDFDCMGRRASPRLRYIIVNEEAGCDLRFHYQIRAHQRSYEVRCRQLRTSGGPEGQNRAPTPRTFRARTAARKRFSVSKDARDARPWPTAMKKCRRGTGKRVTRCRTVSLEQSGQSVESVVDNQ